MMIYYCADDCNFYLEAMKSDYQKANSWPENLTEVDVDMFSLFQERAPEGMTRGADENGMPAWVELPVLTQGQLAGISEQKKVAAMSHASEIIAPLQDAVDLDEATDEEVALLKEWKKYRVLLMRVDTAAPDWPTAPGG